MVAHVWCLLPVHLVHSKEQGHAPIPAGDHEGPPYDQQDARACALASILSPHPFLRAYDEVSSLTGLAVPLPWVLSEVVGFSASATSDETVVALFSTSFEVSDSSASTTRRDSHISCPSAADASEVVSFSVPATSDETVVTFEGPSETIFVTVTWRTSASTLSGRT